MKTKEKTYRVEFRDHFGTWENVFITAESEQEVKQIFYKNYYMDCDYIIDIHQVEE